MICSRCQENAETWLKVAHFNLCQTCATQILEAIVSSDEFQIEDLERKIGYITLLEQAQSTSKAKADVLSISISILIHVCKIYFLEGSLERNHWKQEVANWLMSINNMKLKTPKGRLDQKWLYDHLYADLISDRRELVEFISYNVNSILERDQIKLRDISDRDYQILKRFYRTISINMSQGAFKNTQQINNIIGEIIER